MDQEKILSINSLLKMTKNFPANFYLFCSLIFLLISIIYFYSLFDILFSKPYDAILNIIPPLFFLIIFYILLRWSYGLRNANIIKLFKNELHGDEKNFTILSLFSIFLIIIIIYFLIGLFF